jgi:hypothetical protein
MFPLRALLEDDPSSPHYLKTVRGVGCLLTEGQDDDLGNGEGKAQQE